MGRSSGLFETLVKSTFGVGSTVHYKKDWLGRSQKVVKYHDSGKKKTNTYGTGFFGNKTKTKTEKNGYVTEQGYIKKNFLWGATGHAERSDGTKVTREYTPGLFKTHITTHINGQCFKCSGTGSKILDCKICQGTGTHSGSCRLCVGTGKIHLEAKPCFTCQGSGFVGKSKCRRCQGTGQHKPAIDVDCKKCSGTGHFSAPCKKCEGKGNFSVTCNKCNGTGRYSKTEYE